jgi:hypothetical protein
MRPLSYQLVAKLMVNLLILGLQIKLTTEWNINKWGVELQKLFSEWYLWLLYLHYVGDECVANITRIATSEVLNPTSWRWMGTRRTCWMVAPIVQRALPHAWPHRNRVRTIAPDRKRKKVIQLRERSGEAKAASEAKAARKAEPQSRVYL